TYEKLCRAAWWIARGKPYIATHPDQTCPTDQPTLLPDCGSLCALLRSATGRDPDATLGKPDPATLHAVLERHRLQPWQAAMVGDRLNTDIAMACRAGVFGVLVLTGEAVATDVEGASEPPDLVVAHVGELGQHLNAAHAAR
ncbi:MAG TPA: HAD hydrolase-like protein, partial [Chthoniobacteraceae bacterium]|nr:HAD hydrolase-like protein [Chthoniobacteraceae bacterium]